MSIIRGLKQGVVVIGLILSFLYIFLYYWDFGGDGLLLVDYRDVILPFRPADCHINCHTGVPCEYKDEVDFRIIVITYTRPRSLEKCLNHISLLDTGKDTVHVEIWIDQSSGGQVDQASVYIASNFSQRWTNSGRGHSCVHLQERNAGITGQWTDTWRPKETTQEIALILEDDIDIAPMAYRWLKAVHQQYDRRTDVSGYTLQMQDITFFGQPERQPMKGPKEANVFMYSVLGTWGFSPHPVAWRAFQDWSHKAHAEKIKPYVPNIITTDWYMHLEEKGKENSMWEQWHIYFCHINKLYTIYCNLKERTDQDDLYLSWNRKEPGLHYSGRGQGSLDSHLMNHWNATYVQFPERISQHDHNGSIIMRV